jgi:hypothetical protein
MPLARENGSTSFQLALGPKMAAAFKVSGQPSASSIQQRCGMCKPKLSRCPEFHIARTNATQALGRDVQTLRLRHKTKKPGPFGPGCWGE